MPKSQRRQMYEIYKEKYPNAYELFTASKGEKAWQEYVDTLVELEVTRGILCQPLKT